MNLSRLSSTSRTLFSFLPHTHHHSSPLTPLVAFRSLESPTPFIPTSSIQKRAASHASEGRANRPPRGPGKRLGAKKSNSELVVPGNIIFRQRGSHWFPGENCGMGRDHTIFALEKGFVVYYKDPDRHPERKYIGVVFERGQRLPMPRGAARRRRLGMVETTREISTAASQGAENGGEGIVQGAMEGQDRVLAAGQGMKEAPQEVRKQLLQKVELRLKKGYMYRESNWQIGRAAERANVKVREYDARDRFAAWRRKAAREAAEAQKKALKPKRGGK